MKKVIAKIFYAVIAVITFTLMAFVAVIAGVAWCGVKAVDWLDLHANFDGDADAQKKERWRG